jgi:glycosyltransferase involved in cell wall biosynthesis
LPNTIIVNSLEFKNEYKKKFNLNPICIYNPLNRSEIIKNSKIKINFKFFQDYNGLKILFIGRLVDQKDPFTFIKALNLIQDKIYFRAVIIGKGYLRNDLIKYIEENNLSKKIKIIKWKKIHIRI